MGEEGFRSMHGEGTRGVPHCRDTAQEDVRGALLAGSVWLKAMAVTTGRGPGEGGSA